jgi:uncharacterized membrane protein YjgN (DUF898 family)
MEKVEFHGKTLEFFKIWITNIFLVIITLGIYYPWAKIRVKKYFYKNTSINDYFFDFHATGKQLFIGYVIAIFLLVAVTFLSNFVPFIFFGLFLFFPFFLYRSLKFNLAHTSFANIRFSFTNNIKNAYIAYIIYMLPIIFGFFLFGFFASIFKDQIILLVISLILAIIFINYTFALYVKMMQAYLYEGVSYANEDFFHKLATKDIIKVFIKSTFQSLLFIVISCLIFGISFMLFQYFIYDSFNPEYLITTYPNAAPILIGSIVFIFYIALLLFNYIAFIVLKVNFRNYLFSKVYFEKDVDFDNCVMFSSKLKLFKTIWIYISNFILILFTFGLAYPYTVIRKTKYFAKSTFVSAPIGFEHYISSNKKKESAIGEEIGDAFNVDADLGIGI